MLNANPHPVAPAKSEAERKNGECEPYDLRFRTLLGAKEWAALPEAVQARFSKRLSTGVSANFHGHVTHCRMNFWGRIFSQLCRVVGAPLPLDTDSGTAANVSVTEDGANGGQNWTRIYARKRGFPQVIHSAKRFAGPSGLEEFVGRGIGVSLEVEPIEQGIRFAGNRYFIMAMGRRLMIPAWLGPGKLNVEHVDLGNGSFTFTLKLQHHLFGLMICQQCHFRDGE